MLQMILEYITYEEQPDLIISLLRSTQALLPSSYFNLTNVHACLIGDKEVSIILSSGDMYCIKGGNIKRSATKGGMNVYIHGVERVPDELAKLIY